MNIFKAISSGNVDLKSNKITIYSPFEQYKLQIYILNLKEIDRDIGTRGTVKYKDIVIEQKKNSKIDTEITIVTNIQTL